MSNEFKDYFEYIYDNVVDNLQDIPYSKTLVSKNYFRIKIGFYEDEDPDSIVNDLVFQIKEQRKEIKSLITEGVLKESKVFDYPVRKIVRYIVDIIKKLQPRRYYLPEDLNIKDREGEVLLEFDFNKIPNFAVEFDFKIDSNIKKDYLIDGSKYDDEDTIEIVLILNPKQFPTSMYDIIADLNDIVAHEIEHLFQDNWLRPQNQMDPYEDFPDERPNDKEYYKQPHEVPAELKGFRRVNKLRKEPIEKTIKDWFKRNQTIHQLNDEDIEELTLFLSQKYKEKYGKQ